MVSREPSSTWTLVGPASAAGGETASSASSHDWADLFSSSTQIARELSNNGEEDAESLAKEQRRATTSFASFGSDEFDDEDDSILPFSRRSRSR